MSLGRALVGVGVAVAAPFGLFLYWRTRFFFRDPHRVPPADPQSVVAPADGFVTYVKRVDAGSTAFAVKKGRTIPLDEIAGVAATESGYLIGIYMSEYSVHRNRIPISGTIGMRRHRSAAPFNKSMARVGANLLTRRTPYDEGCDYILSNERLTISIEHSSGSVVTVTQIADLWVDRIVAHVAVGDTVERGEQYGMIRFGSQCDVFVPDALAETITVRPGQYVFAGESVVARSPIPVADNTSREKER
ncbi:phosphatidylserine decarboxylase [Rhodococcus sp. 06-221-2]|uniref:phosphatidylserine decarboxylase n=1 Tax=Rhodococcus sp. 06-221-2 TaxID=2022514 RepID=UPI000B9B8D39|nr:phosphatidylserine decarboxylase [Rhodococcus sp. 06-221-2]OZD09640.1 phosphatidylserine decarboxylase [Rhodococcus sp. 06-221-2]